MLATIAAAARMSGRSRPTIEQWIQKGWLPTTEILISDGSYTQSLVEVDDIPAAEETARRAGRPRVQTWSTRVDGEWQQSIAPKPGSREHRAMSQWLRANRRLF